MSIMLKHSISIKEFLAIIPHKINNNCFIESIINNPLTQEELLKGDNIELLEDLVKNADVKTIELIYSKFKNILEKERMHFSILNKAIEYRNTNLIHLFFAQPENILRKSIKPLNSFKILIEVIEKNFSFDIIKYMIDNMKYEYEADMRDFKIYTDILIKICNTGDIKLVKQSLDYLRTIENCEIDVQKLFQDVKIILNFEVYSFLQKEFPQYKMQEQRIITLHNIYTKMTNKPHYEVLKDEDYNVIFKNMHVSFYRVKFITKNSFNYLMDKYNLRDLKNYIIEDFLFESVEDLKNFNLQDLIYKFLYIQKELNISFNNVINSSYCENEFNTMEYIFKKILSNPNYKDIIAIIKKIEENRLFNIDSNIFDLLHQYNIDFSNIKSDVNIKPLFKWINKNFLNFERNILNDFKIILTNYSELIDKNISMENWVNYSNIINQEKINKLLPEVIDIFLSSNGDSSDKKYKVNISEQETEMYLKMLEERKEVFNVDNFQLPFYKNIIKDKNGDYLLYEMLPGFDPKSLLVNHALDCCLVAGGAAANILSYMANNPETCGMFVISKINYIQIIDILKLKIKEINNICNTQPFNMQDYITINNEIKLMLVDRENKKSNITILGASFTYKKENSLVFDNIETNNKTFIEDENGNNVRYNTTTVPFMKCYAEYSKIAMQYNENITYSSIGMDIPIYNLKK